MSGEGAIPSIRPRPVEEALDAGALAQVHAEQGRVPVGVGPATGSVGFDRSRSIDTGPVKAKASALPAPEGNLDVTAAVARLSLKIKTGSFASQSSILKVRGEQLKTQGEEEARNIAENLKNALKADKGGLIGKILGWIAAVLTVAVGVLTANPAMAAMGVLACGMMVATECGAMEKLAELIGPEAMIAVMVVLMVAMLAGPSLIPAACTKIAAVVNTALNGGGAGAKASAAASSAGAAAGSAGATAGSTGAAAGSTGATAGLHSSSAVSMAARLGGTSKFAKLRLAGDAVTYGTTAAAGVNDAVTSSFQYRAGIASANTTRAQGEMTMTQANIDHALKIMERHFQLSNDVMNKVKEMMTQDRATSQSITRSMV